VDGPLVRDRVGEGSTGLNRDLSDRRARGLNRSDEPSEGYFENADWTVHDVVDLDM
jgi:hypothetical protein